MQTIAAEAGLQAGNWDLKLLSVAAPSPASAGNKSKYLWFKL